MAFEVSPRTLNDLGWTELVRHLRERTQTDGGRELADRLGFIESADAVRAELLVAADAARLYGRRVTLTLGDASDVRAQLALARKEGVLDGTALWRIQSTLGVVRDLRRFCQDLLLEVPHLAGIGHDLGVYEEERRQLERCLEPSGMLQDAASSQLYELRRRVIRLHAQIKKQLDELMEALDRAALLQDRYFTMREDRYVLPVKVEHRRQVAGIVHGASHTGQTLFIEPAEIMEPGNQLKVAQAEVVEEEQRILRELSLLVAERAVELDRDLERLFLLDLAWAKGRLGHDLEAAPAEVATDGVISLVRLRHPLMVLADKAGTGPKVVPNTLTLDAAMQALIITGPNTGGKTVLLKTIGLCALMHRAGLLLPVDAPSRLPLFDAVACTIGDAQSLSAAQSTFSSHISTIAAGLDTCRRIAEVGGVGLALLDELVADTDPRQGAALAQAIVEALMEQGARVVVTTHHEPLKAAALTVRGMHNAAMGFDPETLEPTYELVLGVPGSSNPFDIAARWGMPDYVVSRARVLVSGQADLLEQALRRIEEQERAARKARQEAEEARREAVAVRADFELKRKVMAERSDAMMAEARREARQHVEEQAAEARAIIAKLQRGETAMKDAVASQKELERRAAELTVVAPAAEPEKRAAVEVGSVVRVVGMGTKGVEGEVLEVDRERADALVLVGQLRSRIPLTRLIATGRRSGDSTSTQAVGGKTAKQRKQAWLGEDEAATEASLKCDLRGRRADEAAPAVEAFLDESYKRGVGRVLIVHGTGTGTLKRVIHAYLKSSPYVGKYKQADPDEGGEGVTVVELV